MLTNKYVLMGGGGNERNGYFVEFFSLIYQFTFLLCGIKNTSNTWHTNQYLKII